MNELPETEKGREANYPLDIVTSIRNQVFLHGANDHEKSAFNDILDKLRKNPDYANKAIDEARQILALKQDYH